MLKRPGPALFATNFGNSPTRTPKGQAGPHRSLGVSKRGKLSYSPGASQEGELAGQFGVPGALPRDVRGWRALAGCAAPGSAAARARAPVRGELSEGTCAGARSGSGPAAAGGRGGQRRSRGGARTPSSVGLLEVAARPRVGGRQALYPEPRNLGLLGVKERRERSAAGGGAARCCSLLRLPLSV